MAQNPTDLEFVLHENAVNKVLERVGEISGSNDYEVFIVRGKYHWKVKGLTIHFSPVKSTFECVADVKAGLIEYSTPVKGFIDIRYDSLRDKIQLLVRKADFEIYTMFAGRKITLKTIHLEEYFKEPFEFDGPMNYSASVDVPVNDTAKKTLWLRPEKCKLMVLNKKVLLTSMLGVSDKPFVRLDSINPKSLPDTSKAGSSGKK
ncbi:MAG: hypothetical protein N3F09_07875 [Bacteroidia bacterium]|nr:hypothetical protein [Bacteroidia bacterium]